MSFFIVTFQSLSPHRLPSSSLASSPPDGLARPSLGSSPTPKEPFPSILVIRPSLTSENHGSMDLFSTTHTHTGKYRSLTFFTPPYGTGVWGATLTKPQYSHPSSPSSSHNSYRLSYLGYLRIKHHGEYAPGNLSTISNSLLAPYLCMSS